MNGTGVEQLQDAVRRTRQREFRKYGRAPEQAAKKLGDRLNTCIPFDVARRAWNGDQEALRDLIDRGWNPWLTTNGYWFTKDMVTS